MCIFNSILDFGFHGCTKTDIDITKFNFNPEYFSKASIVKKKYRIYITHQAVASYLKLRDFVHIVIQVYLFDGLITPYLLSCMFYKHKIRRGNLNINDA